MSSRPLEEKNMLQPNQQEPALLQGRGGEERQREMHSPNLLTGGAGARAAYTEN